MIDNAQQKWLIRWISKPLLFIACLLPFAGLLLGVVNDDLGANPIETLTHVTGDWALRLLILTLAMTPLRRLTGWGWPLRLRRMLGLFVFFYASAHFLTWAWLDQGFYWSEILTDIAKRPYVTVGFLAWIMLWPLALTSNKASQMRLKGDWKRLHRLVYPIAVLAVLHYLWLVKADWSEPLIYGLILAGLLLLRWKPQSSIQRRAVPVKG